MPSHSAPCALVRRLAGRLAVARNNPAAADATDAGFTIVEVLVSTIILVIVGTATAAAVIGGVNSSNVTRTRVAATNLAQQALQQAVNLPRASLTATPSPAPSTATIGNTSYTVTRTVTYPTSNPSGCPAIPAAGVPNTMVVNVTVSGGGAQNRSVAMSTVLAC